MVSLCHPLYIYKAENQEPVEYEIKKVPHDRLNTTNSPQIHVQYLVTPTIHFQNAR